MKRVPFLLFALAMAASCSDGVTRPEATEIPPASVEGMVPEASAFESLATPELEPGQVAYVYVGNPFDEFTVTTSYTTGDHVTATLVLDDPLPADLDLEDISGYAGFAFEISDGHQTLTGVSEALVSTDSEGQIIGPWSFIRNMGGVLNNGVATVDWPGSRGVFDMGTLSAASGSYPDTPFDMGWNYGPLGTWTMVTGEFSCASVTEIPEVECQALVALYLSTNGPGWTNDDGWLADSNPCNWFGVLCTGESINALELYENQMTGPLPPQLANLTNLERIYFWSNSLNGTIPAELGTLDNLEWIHLDDNEFTGGIPAELGDLSSLTHLILSYNDLTGSIPPELGDLSNLEYLMLALTDLTGGIPPELGNLTNLKALYLPGTPLGGTIPPELGNLSDLQLLYLSGTELMGSIPPELGNLTGLYDLNLSGNQLTGEIPSELAELSNLYALGLNGNQLTGPIPSGLGTLPDLIFLHLQGNQLDGLVPLDLAERGGLIQETVSPSNCRLVPSGNEGLYQPDIPSYRDADLDNDNLICGLGFTTDTEAVSEDLTEELDDLVTEEVINTGQGNALTQKLDQAERRAERGQYKVAINLASAFINQVNDLVATGVLTAEEAAPLLERAAILIELWESM